jgi:predicted RNase H-like nuclease (RuvC/YqgF family)
VSPALDPAQLKAALERLGAGVDRLLRSHAELRTRLNQTEARVREVEGMLGRLGRGEVDVAGLSAEVEQLSAENAALRARMDEGREAVDRLLSRVRYLEEQG